MKMLKKTLIAAVLATPLSALAAEATLYKDPNCGCCTAYAKILEQHGHQVTLVDRTDMSAVKAEHKVPKNLRSCHTTVIGNYVVEGHVPVGSVERLLEEKPLIRGIAVPGMPMGSPGMGERQGPIDVYFLADTAEPELFESR